MSKIVTLARPSPRRTFTECLGVPLPAGSRDAIGRAAAVRGCSEADLARHALATELHRLGVPVPDGLDGEPPEARTAA